jgi:hypothetical protein
MRTSRETKKAASERRRPFAFLDQSGLSLAKRAIVMQKHVGIEIFNDDTTPM